jgi:hypothetical protein
MKGKAKNVSAGVAPQDKKKVGPVDPKGAYTKVQQRTLGKMKMGGTLSPVKGNVSKNVSNLNKAKSGGSFPDLNKDGKITQADILKGRGVIAKKGASVKKAQMGATVTSAPVMMKKGGSMKKCKYGCK